MQSDLFSPVTFGSIDLSNRLVMAPMTRGRAGDHGIPGDLVVEYYRQRASAGLIVTEGTYPGAAARAYVGQPGMVTVEQREAWRRVAEAVHSEGGRIVMQLMHGGRVAHPTLNGGRLPVAPSPLAVAGDTYTAAGKVSYVVPRPLKSSEILSVIDEHVQAARAAVEVGFDGVEIHAANGYLLHEFLSSSSNVRTDDYGGTPGNRTRFAAELVEAVADAVGGGRVGVRISPSHAIHDVVENSAEDVRRTYLTLVRKFVPFDLAYLSILHSAPEGVLVQSIRREFSGPVMINSGFSRVTSHEEAKDYIAGGIANAVAVGRPFAANPDLVHRWRERQPVVNDFDPRSSYGTTAVGYTDYPSLTPVND